MKKTLFALIACAAFATVKATPVLFPLNSMFMSGAYTTQFRIDAVNPIVTDGSSAWVGSYMNITPSGVTNPIVDLPANDYLVTFTDARTPWRIRVPNTTNLQNAVTLTLGPLPSFWWSATPLNLTQNFTIGTDDFNSVVSPVIHSATNGLASTNDINIATNGLVTASVTNGLVTAAVTNGLVNIASLGNLPPGYSSLNTALMKPIIDRFNAGTNLIRVFLTGDSMTFYGESIPHRMQDYLSSINNNIWYAPIMQQSMGSVSWSTFNCAANMPWYTNWIGGVYFGMTNGQSYTSVPYTNVNTVDVFFLPQSTGNANLGFFTNNVLMTTFNGYSPTATGVFTNLSLPTGNYTFKLQTTAGALGETNIVFQAAAYNTNAHGFVFFDLAKGGLHLTDIYNCGDPVVVPYLKGVNPDLVLYNAKDFGETGNTAAGLSNAYVQFTHYVNTNSANTNVVWVFGGTPDQGVTPDQLGQAWPQNSATRAFCQGNGCVFADCWIGEPDYQKFYAKDDTHPNYLGGQVMANAQLQAIGFGNSTSGNITSASYNTNGSSATNIPLTASANTFIGASLANTLYSGSALQHILVIGDTTAEQQGGVYPPTQFQSDLQAIYGNYWSITPSRQSIGNTTWSGFSAAPNPSWISTNWLTQVSWAATNGQSVTWNQFTNVNLIEVTWLKQPSGNANLGIYTNNVLALTVSGFNASGFAGGYTNFTVATGNYTVKVGTVSGATTETNLILSASGQNTAQHGFAFYYITKSGLSASSLYNCGTNVLTPMFTGMTPDYVLWFQRGGSQTATDYTKLMALMPAKSKLIVVGQPEYDPVARTGFAVATFYRNNAVINNWIFINAYAPYSFWTSFLTADGTFYNAYGSQWVAAAIEKQMGLFGDQADMMALSSNFPAAALSGITTNIQFTNSAGVLLTQHITNGILMQVTAP